jgi:uncharacterized protein (TIGR00369 family)
LPPEDEDKEGESTHLEVPGATQSPDWNARKKENAMPTLLDQAQMICRGEMPPPPIATLLGFTLTSITPGQAIIAFEAGASHANPMGTLHGGVLGAIADAAMGIAYASLLEEGKTFTTLELKINFLKPIWHARLQAVGQVVKHGRTVGLVECDITDSSEALVARAMSTCMTLRGDQAQGR